jgi:hypothetical protein
VWGCVPTRLPEVRNIKFVYDVVLLQLIKIVGIGLAYVIPSHRKDSFGSLSIRKIGGSGEY